jgi:hypothetical protein
VVGRYGFADAGDLLNAGSGAFMGDLLHRWGERLGDVVLVAAEEVGRGRVLVFGDTSPFQNGAWFLSQGLVSNSIRWVAGEMRALAVRDDALAGGAPALEPGGAASLSAEPARLAYADEVALVDFSLRPRAALALFGGASLGGLANCLARAGVVAVPAFSSAAWTQQARYLFLVSPTRFGRRDAARLTTYIDEGGNVILAEGYTERKRGQPPFPLSGKRWLSPLLGLSPFSVENVPLGAGEPGGRVVYKDAWAISYAGPETCPLDTIVRSSAFGYPTVVTKRLGRGSLTLISDGRFLVDDNLEGERRGEPRNIAFVTDLISALRKERARSADSACGVERTSSQ